MRRNVNVYLPVISKKNSSAYLTLEFECDQGGIGRARNEGWVGHAIACPLLVESALLLLCDFENTLKKSPIRLHFLLLLGHETR